MSAALPSDEVALDFQDSLQDLQNNNRYEISNLTIIAKENTEHAQAISQVLEKHIRTVRLGKYQSPYRVARSCNSSHDSKTDL